MDKGVTLKAQATVDNYISDIKLAGESMPTTIRNDADCESANRALKIIMAFKKDITNKRLSFTRPLDEVKKALIDSFRRPVSELEQWENKIKGMIKIYLKEKEQKQIKLEQEQKRKQALAEAEIAARAAVLEEDAKEATDKDAARELQEQAEAAKLTPVEVVAPIATSPTLDRRMFKTRYMAVVVDMSLLPNEFKLPNMPALNKLAQQNEGKNPPLGVEFKEK